eukprot:15257862-Alexandrium_andersonii.AAC.1
MARMRSSTRQCSLVFAGLRGGAPGPEPTRIAVRLEPAVMPLGACLGPLACSLPGLAALGGGRMRSP